MDRLSKQLKLPIAETFTTCQICGYASTDICEFRMWEECDEKDIPEKEVVIIVCIKNKKCRETINNHPRLYIEIPWGMGGPGRFMLLCGPCKFRDSFPQKTVCKHPDLKVNGGEGLEVNFSNLPILNARVCLNDGTSMQLPRPATKCAGFEKK